MLLDCSSAYALLEHLCQKAILFQKAFFLGKAAFAADAAQIWFALSFP